MYTPTVWVTGDIITATKANNGETQFEESTEETLSAEVNASAGAITPNLSVSKYYNVALDGNLTINTPTNVAGSSRVDYFVVKVKGGGVARTLTGFSELKWTNNAAPTLPTTSGEEMVLYFLKLNNANTRWIGMVSAAGVPA
jgi:hypothetical protein